MRSESVPKGLILLARFKLIVGLLGTAIGLIFIALCVKLWHAADSVEPMGTGSEIAVGAALMVYPIFGFLFTVVGISNTVIGIGLLQLRRWARISSLFFDALMALRCGWATIRALLAGDARYSIIFLVMSVIAVKFFLYLRQRNVRAAFD